MLHFTVLKTFMIKNRSVASIFSILLSVSLCLPAPLLAQTGAVSDVIQEVSQPKAPASGVSLDSKVSSILPETNPYRISIPEQFGSIEELFQGSADSPLIVYIQNVHSNYEAQLNIKNILAHLVDQYQFSLIQLEGAVSKLDPAILQPSYLKEANLKLVDFLMREGRITGADAFAVETEKPVELHGIEDYSLYMENLKMFKSIYKHQEELKPYFDEVHRLILAVGPKMLNPEQLDFTRKTEEFSTDKIDLLDYVTYMNQISERHKLVSLNEMPTIVDYPNLTRLMRLKNLEEKLNQAGLKKETEALKAEFRKKLPESKQLDEVLLRLDESAKGLNPRAYFLELTDLADQADIDFSIYPAFRIFAEFLIHQDEIDHRVLFSELKKFEEMLQEKLFTTEDEKMFLSLIDHVSLLEQFFRLEVSREKIALYLKDQEQVKPSWIIEQVKGLAEKHAVVSKFSADAAHLDAYRKEVEYFYQLVLKRDEIFSEKIITKTKSLSLDKTIVVTGGFHKDGLIDHFRKEKISYVIINPKVDVKQGNENYLKVMLEDDAIVGSVFAGTFAVEIKTRLLQSAFRNLNENRELRNFWAAVVPLTILLSPNQSVVNILNLINARFREVAPSTGIVIEINEPKEGAVSAMSMHLTAEAELFDESGKAVRYELTIQLIKDKSGDHVRVQEVKRIKPTGVLQELGITPPVAPQTIPITGLLNLTQVSRFSGGVQQAIVATEESFPVNVFVPKLYPEGTPGEVVSNEALAVLVTEGPRTLSRIRAELRKGIPFTLEMLNVVPAVSRSSLSPAAEGYINFVDQTVNQPRELAFVLSADQETATAELRALRQALLLDLNVKAVLYGTEDQKALISTEMGSLPVRANLFPNHELAVKRFYPYVRSRVLLAKGQLGVLVPSGEAGAEEFSSDLAVVSPETLQISDTSGDLAVTGMKSGREAVAFNQIRLLARLTGLPAVTILRLLQDLEFKMNQMGFNVWSLSPESLALLVEAYAFQRVAVSA